MTTKKTAAPTKAQGQLDLIAAEMRQFVAHSGFRWLHRRLARGLEVVLQKDDRRQWRLALARPDIQPSPEEIAICQRAFNVPAGTEATLLIKERKATKSTAPVRVYVAEMYWTEQE